MKKFISPFFILFLLQLTAQAQYQKRYATPNMDETKAVDTISSGGNVIAGSTLIGSWYPFIMRTDKKGNLEWAYTYELFGIDQHFNDIVSSKWAGAAFAAIGQADYGYGAFGSFDIYFTMVDYLGTPVVSKRFGTASGDLATHIENFYYSMNRKGFVFTGKTAWSLSEQDINIGLVNDQGNLISSRIYQYPLVQQAYWVENTKDRGFIIVGTTGLDTSCDYTQNNIFVVKLGPKLNVEWNVAVDIREKVGYSSDIGYAVKQDSMGNYQVTGVSRQFDGSNYISRPFLLSLDQQGKVLSLNVYYVDSYTSAETYSLLSITINGESENLLSGSAVGAYFNEALLINTDSLGKVNWAWTYPPSYSQSGTKAKNIEQNPQTGGYVMTGDFFDAHPPNTGYDINLIETDQHGKSGEYACETEVKVKNIESEYCITELKLTGLSELSQMNVYPFVAPLDLETSECKDDDK